MLVYFCLIFKIYIYDWHKKYHISNIRATVYKRFIKKVIKTLSWIYVIQYLKPYIFNQIWITPLILIFLLYVLISASGLFWKRHIWKLFTIIIEITWQSQIIFPLLIAKVLLFLFHLCVYRSTILIATLFFH